jgi:hypothetical protein
VPSANSWIGASDGEPVSVVICDSAISNRRQHAVELHVCARMTDETERRGAPERDQQIAARARTRSPGPNGRLVPCTAAS